MGLVLAISGGEWRHLMEDIVIYHNILGIIVSFIYVFSVIFLARF